MPMIPGAPSKDGLTVSENKTVRICTGALIIVLIPIEADE